MNLRKEFPFGSYRPNNLNNRITIFGKEVTIQINKYNDNPKLEGKTFNVVSISDVSLTIKETSEIIFLEKSNQKKHLKQSDFILKFKNIDVNINDLPGPAERHRPLGR